MSHGRILFSVLVLLGSLATAAGLPAARSPGISIRSNHLPDLSLPPALPERPIFDCLRTHWRVGHLPPALERMPEAYAKAGYEVIPINALRKGNIAPLPAEHQRPYGHPDRSEMRGTSPSREEIIPLFDIRVLCRLQGVLKATLQPGYVALPMQKREDAVGVVMPRLEMHAMVVFE